MSINTTCLETNLQTQIDGFTCATAPEDLLSAANSTKNLTTDIESYVALGCELPDLNEGKTPAGSMFYVDELGIPVVAGSRAWQGIDGRIYRSDIVFFELFATGISSSTNYPNSLIQECTSSTNWADIETQGCYSSGIKSDGTLWSWGNNCGFAGYNGGALGTGNLTNYFTIPGVQEMCSSTNWCNLGSGFCHNTAIKTDGTLWSWGQNLYGELGTNTRAAPIFSNYAFGVLSPVQEITSSTDWCLVTTEFGFSSAIKTDGTIWGWGYNLYGGIGNNDTVCYSSPVQEISSTTTWCTAIGGASGAHAIKTDGTLWSWGFNGQGQLGDNSIVCASSPVQEITSSATWCQVGGSHGLKTDGTLWGWGRNNLGFVGDGTAICRSSPVQEITSGTSWCFFDSKRDGVSAIKTDSTLWVWGCNFLARLGTGNCTVYSSPVREITSGSNWCCSSIGFGGMLAIKVS